MLSLVDKCTFKCKIPNYMGWNFHHLWTMVCPSLQAPLPLQRRSKFTGWECRASMEHGQGSGHHVWLAQWVTHPGLVSAHTVPFHSAPCPSETGRVSWVRREVIRCEQRRLVGQGHRWSGKAPVWANQIFMLDRPFGKQCGFERQRLFRRWRHWGSSKWFPQSKRLWGHSVLL